MAVIAREAQDDDEELEWIQTPSTTIRQDFSVEYPSEGVKEKFIRRMKENPFVPIGAIATTIALSYGVWCMGTGQSRKSQLMMRTRVAAQGFTIVALLVGLGLAAAKTK